jgi:hypothetical protein
MTMWVGPAPPGTGPREVFSSTLRRGLVGVTSTDRRA